MKLLLDTNVLVSAYALPGVCRRFFAACIRRHIVYTSPYILNEMHTTLVQKFHIPEADVNVIVRALHSTCKVIRDIDDIPAVSRDRKDDPILAAALHCNADYLVTGDHDLLSLKAYKGIPIVAPGALMKAHPTFQE